MSDKKSNGLISLAIVVIAAIIIAMIPYTAKRISQYTTAPPVVCDTTTVTFYDTVTVYKPVPRDSIVLRYETARLPISGNNEVKNIPEKCNMTAENILDSANVVIPISQIEVEDSTYHVWASGYRVSIDSLKVYPRTDYITITKTITPKPKRWHIGVTAGYGYTPQGFKPYVGVGVTYSIFSF